MKFSVAMVEGGGFEVHRAGCADLGQKQYGGHGRVGRRQGRLTVTRYTGPPWTRDAESAEAALDAELREDFSGTDGGEHPAQDGYPAGSFGAAGFDGRVFPCARKEKAS